MNYTLEEEQTYKTQIKELIQQNSHGYTNHILKDNILMDYINFKTPLLQDTFYTLATKLYWLLNDIHDFPECPYCHKQDKFIHSNVLNVNLGYRNIVVQDVHH